MDRPERGHGGKVTQIFGLLLPSTHQDLKMRCPRVVPFSVETGELASSDHR